MKTASLPGTPDYQRLYNEVAQRAGRLFIHSLFKA
jgi:hypothetical protein